MTERVEKRQQPADEPRDFNRFLHPFRVEERPFDEILQHFEIPFRMILRQHNLWDAVW